MTANVTRSGWRERLIVLAILLVSLAARSRDLAAPFDREFEGAQGAFFAIGAVNYERLGLWRSGGYPVVNIDLGPVGGPTRAGSDLRDLRAPRDTRDLRDEPSTWYLYANHPPLVPLLAWSALRVGDPEGLDRSAKDHAAPANIEPWIRAPFLAAGILALFALWWAIREAAGPRRAALALGVASLLPISVIYGTLVNYENPALVCILFAVGYFARWMRDQGARSLAGVALWMAAGSVVTYSALFFLPALALVVAVHLGWKRALWFSLASGSVGLVPIVAHGAWSAIVHARLGLVARTMPDRARELLSPLLDGSESLGHWALLQFTRVGQWFTVPVALCAALGAVLWLAHGLRGRFGPKPPAQDPEKALNLEPALLAGAALFLLANFRHTLDPQHTFLILLIPAVAGFAALALDHVASALARRGMGALPIALLVSALAMQGLQRANDLRFDFRSSANESQAERAPPLLPLPNITGAEFASLVAPGDFGIHPACMGLNNPAVSFYAWRSLWAVKDPEDTQPWAVARFIGLGGRRHVLLLPKHPWPAIAEAVGKLERTWAKDIAPDRESENWRAWDLH